MRKLLVGWAALAAALVFSVASYPGMPEQVPVHWNVEFEADDYGPKWVVALLVPCLLMFVPLLAWALSRIDPRRSNYETHRVTYWSVWTSIMLLLAVIQSVMVALALGWRLDSARVFPIVFGFLFVVIGNISPRLRPNWFLGIRTPWTLSSDDVWRRTHRIGGRMLMAAGFILIIAGLLPYEWVRSVSWPTALGLAAGIPVVYSYVEWRRVGRPERPAAS